VTIWKNAAREIPIASAKVDSGEGVIHLDRNLFGGTPLQNLAIIP